MGWGAAFSCSGGGRAGKRRRLIAAVIQQLRRKKVQRSAGRNAVRAASGLGIPRPSAAGTGNNYYKCWENRRRTIQPLKHAVPFMTKFLCDCKTFAQNFKELLL